MHVFTFRTFECDDSGFGRAVFAGYFQAERFLRFFVVVGVYLFRSALDELQMIFRFVVRMCVNISCSFINHGGVAAQKCGFPQFTAKSLHIIGSV